MYRNLVKVRKSKKLTIRDMGKIIGKSPANYYKKEMGNVVMSVREAILIANYLEETISYLFKEEEN